MVRLEGLRAIESQTRGVAEKTRGPTIAAAYDKAFAGLAIDRVPDDQLVSWYRAAQIAAFYTHDAQRAQTMARVLGALESRGRSTDHEFTELYETYVGARLIEDARALALRHPLPAAEPLPTFRTDTPVPRGTPSMWVVDPAGGKLIERPAAINRSLQVVVVSHPKCHFTQNAATELEQDPELRAALEAHAIWLAPQANHLDVDAIRAWNQTHPGFAIALAVHRNDWPMIDSWSTPTFYILDHGALLAKVEGWPEEGHREELRAALRQFGLLQ